MINRKLTIEIIDGKLDISLTNLETSEAIALLSSSLIVLTNRELLHMGCEKIGASLHSIDISVDKEIEKIKGQFPNDPIAKTISDLVTPKQLVAIRAIANAAGLNAEAECLKHPQLKCRPEELSRSAASKFIGYLKLRISESELSCKQ